MNKIKFSLRLAVSFYKFILPLSLFFLTNYVTAQDQFCRDNANREPSYSNNFFDWNNYDHSTRNGNEIIYNWLYGFDGEFTSMSMTIIFNRGFQYMQDVYKRIGHIHGNYYNQYVGKDPFEIDVGVIAKILGEKAKLYKYDKAKVALSFVQSLPHDPDIGGYQRYAVECLIDRKGDCSDKSVLLMAILTYMGRECISLSYPGHLAVGIREYPDQCIYYNRHYKYNGFAFYFAETNGRGWNIGAETDESTSSAIIERGFINASSVNGETYYTSCEVCGGDGQRFEGRDFGPLECNKCKGRGVY